MSTAGNTSTAGKPPRQDWHTVSLVIYCVIFVVGIVGNGLVIYVTSFRMKRTVNTVWFLNLALADFLFTVFLIFQIISISQSFQWNMGRLMCKLNTFVSVINMFASVFLLLAISVDRCLATWVVVWAQNKRTVFKAKVICLFVWIIAAACSSPYATFRDVREFNNIRRCTYSKESTKNTNFIISLLRFIIGFLIPFVGIFFSYVAIYCRARRLQTRKKRSGRIIISVILAFFICWLPSHIVQILELFSKDKEVLDNIKAVGPVVVSLAYLNSCLNPILYVFMCDDFQKKLKKSICHVLESALADEHLSFMSSRSLSSHFTRTTRRSESVPPGEKDTTSSLCQTENKVVIHLETNED